MASSPFARPATTTGAVVDELRSWIISGRLAPGEAIRQIPISQELGISRLPLREALQILQAEGHLEYRPHHGYTVRPLDAADLVEIYRLRRLLEEEAVRRSLHLLTESDLQDMEAAADAMREARTSGDLLALTDANRVFHFVPFRRCGMPRLLNLVRMLWDASDRYRAIYFLGEDHLDLVDDEHRRIVAAVRAGDIDEVLAALQAHRSNAVEALLVALDDR